MFGSASTSVRPSRTSCRTRDVARPCGGRSTLRQSEPGPKKTLSPSRARRGTTRPGRGGSRSAARPPAPTPRATPGTRTAPVVAHPRARPVEALDGLGIMEHDPRPLQDRDGWPRAAAVAVGRGQPVVARRARRARRRYGASETKDTSRIESAAEASAPEGRGRQGGRSRGNGPSGPSGPARAPARLAWMPHVIHGSERRPLVPGRLLFDEADQLSVIVPASCRRTGRCHECVVEIRAGRRPALAADRPGGVPRTGVPARLPGDAWSAPSATSSSRSCAAGCASCWRRRLPARPRTWTPRSRSSDGRFRARRRLRPGRRDRAARWAWPSTSARRRSCWSSSTSRRARSSPSRRSRTRSASAARDVMTRISYDDEVPGELRQALRRALNHELERLCAELGRGPPAPRRRLRRGQLDDARPASSALTSRPSATSRTGR